jgi:hypothetical protein
MSAISVVLIAGVESRLTNLVCVRDKEALQKHGTDCDRHKE